ncbi:phage holin family protein [Streptomyces sp. SPB074]|uniref:phage holin family protein n=1 Tax=Streptomyces sp. (strain SPB074) TaxID=465543 RepID=UPI00017F192F|nr:phage holin family protein [Streptomyces sp. SPB074]EDY42982.1 integral membrane transporter [Streptomyces sp. SPB074]
MSAPDSASHRPGDPEKAAAAAVSADRSLGQLVAHATSELSALVHDEIALAKLQIMKDVKKGLVGSAAFIVALVLALFSLPMLSFALAYGIHAWSGWHLSVCFLLSFAASLLVAGFFALIGLVFFKKARKGKGPQKAAAAAKADASVLSNAKPHPRPETPELEKFPPLARQDAEGADGATAVARSSS